MNYGGLAIGSLFFWLMGFFSHKVFEVKPWKKIVLAPNWFYILCGVPRIKNLPYGTLSLPGAKTGTRRTGKPE